MGALATFDAAATWNQTHVCDHLLSDSLSQLNATWGRWETDPMCSPESTRAALLGSLPAELKPLHRRPEAGAIDLIQLDSHTPGWPELRRTWQRLQARSGLTLHAVLEGTLVVYLQTGDGYLGVLCEAGEWLAIPAGVRHARDAGEAPDLALLMLFASAEDIVSDTGVGDGPELPSLDAFVETMLELTGHDVDD